MSSNKRVIGVWGLIMINLAALGGIRSWAPIAECGLSSVTFLLLGILFFFLPVALISAELATTYQGGIYEWVKEAFGHRLGFLAIWFLWIENILYYPMMLAFIVSTVTFLISPSLIHNKIYTFISILCVFWSATLINLKGFKASTWISSVGAICGTFIPSVIIMGFGCFWFFHGNQMEISLSLSDFVPSFNCSTLSLFAGVIFSLFGIEMSAIHSGHVNNPQTSYSRAIFLSASFTIIFSVIGVLSIAIVIPKSEIVLSAGALQAFNFFAKAYGVELLLPLISLVIAVGAMGSMSTWIVGPCVGLIAAAKNDDMPSFLRKTDSRGTPRNLLVIQAILVTFISFLFLFANTINSAYWIFLILSTQFYLVMYILLFGAAIKLRYKHPLLQRSFLIPGGKFGIWLIGLAGLAASSAAFIISFFPSSEIQQGHEIRYVCTLSGLFAIFALLPFLCSLIAKKFSKLSGGLPGAF